MRKNLFIAVILMLTASFCYGQHSFEDQIMSDNWDLVGATQFKQVKEKLYPEYSKQLKQHQDKAFELEGYMVPIKAGNKQSSFMLATLPINQCFYCGKNGVPIMVFVRMAEATPFTYQPVKIVGSLKLASGDSMDGAPISLVGAKVSTAK